MSDKFTLYYKIHNSTEWLYIHYDEIREANAKFELLVSEGFEEVRLIRLGAISVVTGVEPVVVLAEYNKKLSVFEKSIETLDWL